MDTVASESTSTRLRTHAQVQLTGELGILQCRKCHSWYPHWIQTKRVPSQTLTLMSTNDTTAPACLRCRGQKLKCSRDLPKCTRCSRLNADCAYPDPPDRKRLAPLRAPPRKRQRQNTATDCNGVSRSPKSARRTSEIVICDQNFQWPSPDLQAVLTKLYFDCSFNSALTLHRPTFERQLKDDSISGPLLLAVCASGTNFLISAILDETDLELGGVGDIQAEGRQWAISAGRQVLQQIEEPSLDGVRTCQILALFWFARDEPHRNNLFAGIAYRTIRSMVLDSVASHADTDRTANQEAASMSEQVRRCFWASWTQYCVNSDHYIVGSSLDPQLMTIRLPISVAAFHNAKPEIQGTLAAFEDKFQFPPSTLSEQMKMLLNWARVRDHVETRAQLPLQQATANMFALDQRLLEWSASLPDPLRYNKRNLYEQLVINQDLSYSAVHALYHQSRLLLHSSLVPQLSGNHLPKDVSLDTVRASAKIALQSAQALSTLASDLSALEWDPSRMAPFIGFCMYASAAIHLTSFNSRRPDLAANARSGLLSSLKLLKAMTPFWKHLERLWARIVLLYKDQVDKPPPRGALAAKASQDGLEDIGQARRDAPGLPEPLSKSLLHHGLTRVRNNIRKDETASTEYLEEEAAQDQLSRVAQALGLPLPIAPVRMQSSTFSAGSNTADPSDSATVYSELSFQDLDFAAIDDSTFDVLQQSNLDTWWSSTFNPLPADNPFLDDLFDPFPPVVVS